MCPRKIFLRASLTTFSKIKYDGLQVSFLTLTVSDSPWYNEMRYIYFGCHRRITDCQCKKWNLQAIIFYFWKCSQGCSEKYFWRTHKLKSYLENVIFLFHFHVLPDRFTYRNRTFRTLIKKQTIIDCICINMDKWNGHQLLG